MSEFSRIGLGTAQFGSDYGISNSSGVVSNAEVLKIFNLAVSHKIYFVDTA